MRRSITEKVTGWIDDAIAKHGQGENILWEHALLPTPDGTALYTVFVWFPSPVLGTVMQGSFQIPDPVSVEAQWLDDTVSGALEAFRQARTQQIEAQGLQGATGAPAVPIRGSQTASGLLIP